ncbi:MAG: hypothetical protein ACYC92_00415 [Candidatus Acidiferrales bacterium]
MRIIRLGPLFAFGFLFSVTAIQAQQASTPVPAPRDAQAVTLLQRSFAALVGATTIKDVTLTGNVSRIAGSDNESGMAILKATSAGQARIDLSLTGGQRSEVTDMSQAAPTGSWSGPDGTWHPVAGHNLFTDPSWFLPTFLVGRVLSNPGYAVSSADAETLDGVAVEHIAIFQQYSGSQQLPSLVQGLSKIDIYLNSSNLLPSAIAFNIHPDNNALTNIPLRVEFSNYKASQGAQVPCHIQKFINNGLVLDLVLGTVQFNTGLSASDFSIQ